MGDDSFATMSTPTPKKKAPRNSTGDKKLPPTQTTRPRSTSQILYRLPKTIHIAKQQIEKEQTKRTKETIQRRAQNNPINSTLPRKMARWRCRSVTKPRGTSIGSRQNGRCSRTTSQEKPIRIYTHPTQKPRLRRRKATSPQAGGINFPHQRRKTMPSFIIINLRMHSREHSSIRKRSRRIPSSRRSPDINPSPRQQIGNGIMWRRRRPG